MRAPVDFKLAGIQPVALFAQRVRRQGQCSGMFAYTHSAPVHRVDMHCPERLQTAITHTRDDREALPQCHSRFCFLSFAAHFRLIFRELACSFLASRASTNARTSPGPSDDDGNTPSAKRRCAVRLRCGSTTIHAGFVLEMFWTHRRFSNAAENPKWNDNALSESRAGFGRLRHDVSVRPLHFGQLLTGFSAFHAHGSNSSRRLIGCPSTMRESTSWR